MGKQVLKFSLVLWMLFLCGTVRLTAQEAGRQKVAMSKTDRLEVTQLEEDSLVVLPSNPVAVEDSMLLIDSLGLESIPAPDENLNPFFSEKMDSLENTWYANKLFQDGVTEVDSPDIFPANLPDSVYISRLKEIEEVVELNYNKVVRNFIELYAEKRRDQVRMMLGLSAYYFPIFEEALDRHRLPLDLKYLPVIESALNPKAHSRMGASGLWQFMFGTARQMNLEITSFVDERRDPVKSTDAAIRYFKYLFDKYGDWQLAIAAYNCGPGNVDRAIRRAGGKKNYWAIYYRLPRETRGYVPAFIAAAYVMNYYKEHNLHPQIPGFPLQTDTVFVNEYLHFNQLTATLDIDKEELRSLNPMYRRDVIPAKTGKTYPLILPTAKIMDFIDKDSLVFAYEREKYFPDNTLVSPTSRSASYYTPVDIDGKAKIIYTVQRGDNVGFISEWFNVRASDLRYWNNIHRNLIRVGQKLLIYVPEGQKDKYERVSSMTFAQKQASIGKSVSSGSTSEQTSGSLDPNYEYYTVKRGDTLWEIAQKYSEISSDEILRLNNLTDGASLSIGQKLKIKAKGNI